VLFSDFHCLEDISANRLTILGHCVSVLPSSVGNRWLSSQGICSEEG